jgi:hypothetical protein
MEERPMSSLSDEYIDEQIERILRSVGTSMRHYMPSSREKLRDAMRLILEDTARLLDEASSEARG